MNRSISTVTIDAEKNLLFAPDFSGCASAELVPFVPLQGIERRYLQRVMMSSEFLEFTASLDRGDRPRVSAVEVSGYSFNLPPTAEQRRIVAKLDALTARLARARAELDRVPVLAERIRQTFASALTTDSRQPIVRFEEVLDYKGGSQPPKSTFHGDPGA